MDEIEGIDGGKVIVLDEPDLESAHEPGRGHREIVAHQDQALDVGAVALPQSADELCRPCARFVVGMEPLFKLVEHDQDFAARRQERSTAHRRRRFPGGSGCRPGRRPRGEGPSSRRVSVAPGDAST